MPQHALAREVETILAGRLDAANDRLLLVNPDGPAAARLVEAVAGRTDPPAVAILAAKDLMKDVMEDFLVASRASELLERDALELRVVDTPPNQSVVVTDVGVTALVSVGEGVGGLDSGDASLVEAANDHYGDMVADADSFTLHTPPLSHIRESLAAEIGEEVAADFDAVLTAIDDAHPDGTGLDEVSISLLVAARNGVLLYDIGKWGEDVGLASKATFSRAKSDLVDAGVIGTEKVPIQVGRPRLRLTLGDDRLREGDPGQMARRASELLTASP